MSQPISPKSALKAVYAEKYVLSLIFLIFAWIEFQTVSNLGGDKFQTLRLIWIEPPVTKGIVLAEMARHVVALLLNASTAILLLLSRSPGVLPQQFKDIAVPLGTTFFVLVYDFSRWFPVSMQRSLCPQGWKMPLIFVGLVLCVIGPAFATWAILCLRRSFGILVVVRTVVFEGPYLRIRHPMYLGYICMLAGLLLTTFSAGYFILVPIHIFLIIYRAKLEETRLCESSAAYRQYQKHSGFLFPKFRGRCSFRPE